MPAPSQRKSNHHAIKNHPSVNPLNQIDLNTDGLESLLADIKTAVQHTAIDVTGAHSIAGGAQHTFPAVDIGTNSGIFEFEIAGVLGHANMDFSLLVSHDNITYYTFPVLFQIIGLNLSSTFDMLFRYHRIRVVNNTGTTHTIDYIQSGRH